MVATHWLNGSGEAPVAWPKADGGSGFILSKLLALVRHAQGIPTLIVLLAALLYVAVVLAQADGDPRDFVRYDGHYSYQIALRNFESPAAVAAMPADYPYRDEVPAAYRYQRILYPLLARWLGLGRPSWILWTLIGINVAAMAVGTWLTEAILRHLKVSHWYALAYGLYGGQFIALRTNLTEPLMVALVMVAILAWLKDRPGWSALAFGLAALTKEFALIFLAAFLLDSLRQRRWHWLVSLAASGLPYLAYQVILWRWLGQWGVSSGQPFILWPFGGWWMAAGIDLLTFLLISIPIVPMAIIPTFAGLAVSGRALLRGIYHPFILSLLFFSLFTFFLPHLTFRESSATVRVIQNLAIAFLLVGALLKSDRILNYSYLWIFTNVLIVKDAV
jgi:hypothetical protein